MGRRFGRPASASSCRRGGSAAGEPLQRELEGLVKYRVKRYRIVYALDRKRKIIRILAVGHRRAVYEELADLVRRRR